MQIPRYEFPDNVKLVNLGDVHLGDERCDVAAFLKNVDYIRRNDNVFWFSTGDMMNVALKNSKSDCYTSMSVAKERSALKKELECIAPKCLGIVGSNHHDRIEREIGMSLDDDFSRELNIPFLGHIAVICVKAGAACYYIAMHHGTGGGRGRGGKANSLEALSAIIPSADVYCEGHTHSYISFINDAHYIDRKRGLHSKFPAMFVTTGHYIQWEGSYAQAAKYKPMPIGSAIIELQATENGKQKKVTCDLLA